MRGLWAGVLGSVVLAGSALAHEAPRDLRLMDFPKTAGQIWCWLVTGEGSMFLEEVVPAGRYWIPKCAGFIRHP